MNLIDQISFHKEKLAKAKSQIPYLEGVIADLEYRLTSERINNPEACLNPEKLISGDCSACHLTNGCSYRFKGEGKRFKL